MGWGILFVACSVGAFVFGVDSVGWPLFLLAGHSLLWWITLAVVVIGWLLLFAAVFAGRNRDCGGRENAR